MIQISLVIMNEKANEILYKSFCVSMDERKNDIPWNQLKHPVSHLQLLILDSHVIKVSL